MEGKKGSSKGGLPGKVATSLITPSGGLRTSQLGLLIFTLRKVINWLNSGHVSQTAVFPLT